MCSCLWTCLGSNFITSYLSGSLTLVLPSASFLIRYLTHVRVSVYLSGVWIYNLKSLWLSHACLVFLKLAFGQIPFFNEKCDRVCVLAWGLDLSPHISLVISCLSCLFEAGLRPASFLITHVLVFVYLSGV